MKQPQEPPKQPQGPNNPTPAFQRAMAQHIAQQKAAKKKKTPLAAKIVFIFIFALAALVVYRLVTMSSGSSGSTASRYQSPGAQEFNAANEMIISDQHGVANGNSPEALQIAQRFSNQIAILRNALFSGGDEKAFSLSDGNFVTYCAVNGQRCAIIVHVPQLRKFTGDAKESMNELAWIVAWSAVADSGLDITELAVGVKGAIQYSAIYTGSFDRTAEEAADPMVTGEGLKDTKLLYPFFAPSKTKKLETPTEEAQKPEPSEEEPLLQSTTGSTTN